MVLNMHHLKGQVPPNSVYIGRARKGMPERWGNPFIIGKDGTREEVISKYTAWLLSQPELIEKAKLELAGKDLVCFCSPHPCHGDVLDAIANGKEYPCSDQS